MNFKWGIFAGAVAFVLSFAVSLISGAYIFNALLRAVIFAALFFGLGTGIWLLISTFMPELLSGDSGDSAEEAAFSPPGSRINITVGESGNGALPESYQNSANPEEMGNISDLLSGSFKPKPERTAGQGMDQQGEDRYTDTGIPAESQSRETALSGEAAPAFAPNFGDSAGSGDLADLDAIAGAFLAGPGEEAAPAAPAAAGGTVRMDIAPPERRVSSKGQPMEGDYSPKELAEGIRTILAKEKG